MSFDLSKCQKNEQGHYLARTKNEKRPVRIICIDRDRQSLCVILRTDDESGRESLHTWPLDSLDLDLENIPQRVKRWVNFCQDAIFDRAYTTEGAALVNAAGFNCIAIAVPVEFEVRG